MAKPKQPPGPPDTVSERRDLTDPQQLGQFFAQAADPLHHLDGGEAGQARTASKVEERAGQSDRYWGDRQRPPSALFGDNGTDYFI